MNTTSTEAIDWAAQGEFETRCINALGLPAERFGAFIAREALTAREREVLQEARRLFHAPSETADGWIEGAGDAFAARLGRLTGREGVLLRVTDAVAEGAACGG